MIRLVILVMTIFAFTIQGCDVPENKSGFGDIYLTDKAPFYEEVMPYAIKFREAIINRDIKAIASYSNSEYQDSISAQLNNSQSELYQYLFSSPISARKLLAKNDVGIKLACMLGNCSPRGGIMIIYYDKSVNLHNTNILSPDVRLKLYRSGKLFIISSFKFDGVWELHYRA